MGLACPRAFGGWPYAARILKGAKPSDLPVESPTRFELVVNIKTADQIGIKLPAALTTLADEIIEEP